MVRVYFLRSNTPFCQSHCSSLSSSGAWAEALKKSACEKLWAGRELSFKESEAQGKLKEILSKVFPSACTPNLSWDLAPGVLLWYQLCLSESVIFGFVFTQEWCSGRNLFQSLCVQHRLWHIAGSSNWYSVLSTFPETHQRENRLPTWGKKLGEMVFSEIPLSPCNCVIVEVMLKFLKQRKILWKVV